MYFRKNSFEYMDSNNGYIQLIDADIHHFVNYCLCGGSRIRRMDIKLDDPMWPGLCNPSIMYDHKTDTFKFVIRNVNYVLHGSKDLKKCTSSWGPVLYSIPVEDGRNLKTRNFIGETKDPMTDVWTLTEIRTRPYTPRWEFWGEEDARLVRWDDILYTTGVRRDDNTTGQGRMELMHISESMDNPQEVSRMKVQALDKNAYCEKNWMPIQDMPFHYVQLANPTTVVRVDPKTGQTTKVVEKERVSGLPDERFDLLRGSSQVIPWRGGHIAIVHTCELWLTAANRKYARYYHLFIEWDADWNIKRVSPVFSFADYAIEFTCGLEYKDGKFYIPFAIEDNFSFLMEVDENIIDKFLNWDDTIKQADTVSHNENQKFTRIFDPNATQQDLYEVGMMYHDTGFFAAAYNIFVRSAELFDYTYNERFMAARSVATLGHRDGHEIGMWTYCIMHDPMRPEAYMAAAMYYKYRDAMISAMYFAQESMKYLRPMLDKGYTPIHYSVEDMEYLYNSCLFETNNYHDAIPLMDRYNISHEQDRRVL